MSEILVLAILGLALALLFAGLILAWRRSSVQAAGRRTGGTMRRRGATLPAGERQAAAFSEAIEDLVNQKLAQIPGLTSTRVDFGTAPDGSLEIWIGDVRYGSVDEIRDQRIRQAVAEAVAAFNR